MLWPRARVELNDPGPSSAYAGVTARERADCMTRRSRGPRGHGSTRFLVGLAVGMTILLSSTAIAGALEEEGAPDGSRSEAGYGVPRLLETAAPRVEREAVRLAIGLEVDQTSETGAAMSRRFLSRITEKAGTARRLVAVPECDAMRVESVTVVGERGLRIPASEIQSVARIEPLGRIRDQAVALLSLDMDALAAACGVLPLQAGLEITLACEGSRGPTALDTGPFGRACARALLDYDLSPESVWRPPASRGLAGRGSVTHCSTAAECAAAGTDVLIVAAASLGNAPALSALATHHATYLGLNVSIFSVADLPELTPEALRNFIRDVYATQSSAGFADGHLGFVLLVGDAFADDNQTVMIPVYNGYGGDEVASDHYYACLSGSDDLEDVMLGRLSVGNLTDLTAVVSKASSYMPVFPDDGWSSSVLLVAGLFFSMRDEYVALFDEYDAIVPESYEVDRIYRHDFETDEQCARAVAAEFNEGHLIVNYAGDGYISSWDQTMNSSHIALMENSGHLPIVLSMACMTGWFDNTVYSDWNGSYDCLAERLVNAPGKGAIACLAAPRSSDGGIFRTITEDIYRAIFEERSIFIGEAIALGKLLHVVGGGDVAYARHLNLFGDPALIFAWDVVPTRSPDLALKPYQTTWSPDFPAAGGTLTADVRVVNQSPVPATDVLVRVRSEHASGSSTGEATIPVIDAWSAGSAVVSLPDQPAGQHEVTVTVDPNDAIVELDESNNAFLRSVYVYPHATGFPLQFGLTLHSPAMGLLEETPCIAVLDENARVVAVDSGGVQAWASPDAANPLDFAREIAPAVGDVDGDGRNEVVATRRLGLAAFDGDGRTMWTALTKEPLGCPVLANVDTDGAAEAVLATVGTFGSASEIVAFEGDGAQIWTHVFPSGAKPTACPCAGDVDLDGHADVVYGTNQGRVGALAPAPGSPTHVWGPVRVGVTEIKGLALGDVDGDGSLEVLVASDALYCLEGTTGAQQWAVPLGADVVSLAVADTDADGVPEVIAGTEAGTLHLIDGGVAVWGAALSGAPGSSAAVADVDGDGAQEILVGTAAGFLHVLSTEGSEIGAPVPVPGGASSPFAGDVDGDEVPEVAVASRDGVLFLLCLAAGEPGSVEWAGIGGNAAHTGLYAQPLSGTIAGSVVLSGNYTVTMDVVVAPGGSLTLLPGTQIAFEGDAHPRLDIRGSLTAHGAQGAEVRFHGDASLSRWEGIVLSPGSTASLSSARVEDASTGISGSLAVLELSGVTADGNLFGALLDRCEAEMTGCTFSRADSVGARLVGGSGTITDCVFTQNGRAGLECRDGATHAVTRCAFAGTSGGDGLACYRLANVVVDSCASTGNSRHGLLVQNASPAVMHTALTGNGRYGVLCRKAAAPSFTRCTVTGNQLGVCAESLASPNLGNDLSPSTGYNSISGNLLGAVTNASGGGVALLARRNWWGSAPPDPRGFAGEILYDPWLASPPSGPETSVPEQTTNFGFVTIAPNPFNPVTTLTYAVPEPGTWLELSVHDLSGRLVATLFSGFRDAGVHDAAWDGRDGGGERVASGVYFARMDSPEQSSTAKLVLLK